MSHFVTRLSRVWRLFSDKWDVPHIHTSWNASAAWCVCESFRICFRVELTFIRTEGNHLGVCHQKSAAISIIIQATFQPLSYFPNFRIYFCWTHKHERARYPVLDYPSSDDITRCPVITNFDKLFTATSKLQGRYKGIYGTQNDGKAQAKLME